jgi:hypothetical protein
MIFFITVVLLNKKNGKHVCRQIRSTNTAKTPMNVMFYTMVDTLKKFVAENSVFVAGTGLCIG